MLEAAREKLLAARRLLAAGIDPGHARKAERIAQAGAESFDAIAREWHVKFSPGWVASHGDRILAIAQIKAPELLAALRRIESRGAHLPERRRMMQAWADYLDALRNGCD